ncbi:MAG TPA: tetrahydromethanopterin-linked C1 transfer pathway, partial [Pirellulales bacterium]|nr:tetrahydromethanopterin-linked C1 transfer pathway [Pirellulales bacterium]
MRLLAFDIGGANLKVADGQGFVASRPFPLWRQPNELAPALAELAAAAPAGERWVATMTGELADCFATKA